MPKYFENELPLPFPEVRVTNSDLSEKWLAAQLAEHEGKISICLRFEGFEADCLGYVFHVETVAEGYRISNITRRKVVDLDSAVEVISMMQHVSGVRYDSDWQTEFQKLRNQITSE